MHGVPNLRSASYGAAEILAVLLIKLVEVFRYLYFNMVVVVVMTLVVLLIMVVLMGG